MARQLSTEVDEVVERMRAIDERLPPDDGVAVFNRVYLEMTELVGRRLQAGYFADAAFMSHLDVVFANLYFDAVDQPGDPVAAPPKAWAPLVEQRATRGLLPIQFSLAGTNAHINHDLAMAVVTTCEQRGVSPRDGQIHDDYERVNELLASIEARVRRSFLDECGRRVDDRLGPVAHLVSSWSMEAARDAAWVTACTLWALRRLDDMRHAYARTLAGQVALTSRALLTVV
jgi:hypothetical protein